MWFLWITSKIWFALDIFSLFAGWFQPAQTSQPTVFSSHKKPATASLNQHQHQPANMPTVFRGQQPCITRLLAACREDCLMWRCRLPSHLVQQALKWSDLFHRSRAQLIM